MGVEGHADAAADAPLDQPPPQSHGSLVAQGEPATAALYHAPDENPADDIERHPDQLSEDEQAARHARWKAEFDREDAFHAAHGTRFSGTCVTCNDRLDHEQQDRQALIDVETERLVVEHRERDCTDCGRETTNADGWCKSCDRALAVGYAS